MGLYGGFLGLAPGGGETSLEQRDPKAHVTVLSGDLNGNDSNPFYLYPLTDNTYHVVSGIDVDSTAILDGFTVTGGNADAELDDRSLGGRIYLLSADVRIIDCRIEGNRAATIQLNSGGGVFASYSDATFEGCVIATNEANSGGGASLFECGGSFYECEFTDNLSRNTDISASDGGGALKIRICDTAIVACEFNQNEAMNSAGAIHIFGITASIIDCTFDSNKATYFGGAIVNDYVETYLSGCVFRQNTADWSGGAMYNNYSPAYVEDCSFVANSTIGFGGAIDSSGGTETWVRCRFTKNTAEYGGAVDNYSCRSTFTDCVFSSNEASEDGGAIRDGGGSSFTTTIDGCIFGRNKAIYGGAIHIETTDAMVKNSIFAGIKAISFGGAGCLMLSESQMEGSAFVGNSAAIGGAFYLYNCDPQFTNCSLSRNRCSVNGPAFYNSTSDPTLTNGLIWNNELGIAISPAPFYNHQISHPNVTYTCIQDSMPGDGSIPYGGTANGNIDESPLWLDGPTGRWTATPSYHSSSGMTTFTDAAASWEPGALEGEYLRVNTLQALAGFIDSNTSSTVTVVGDFSSDAAAGNTYVVYGMELQVGSPAIDSGDTSSVPMGLSHDLVGHPRILNNIVEMGAYEFIPTIPFDIDSDGDVDRDDFVAFELCDSGPHLPYALGCDVFDRDGDDDVDHKDFSRYQLCYSGTGLAADPACD